MNELVFSILPKKEQSEFLNQHFGKTQVRSFNAMTDIDRICEFYGITFSDVKKNITSRKVENVYTRQIIMYMLREKYGKIMSFQAIGDIFELNHATILHGYKTIKGFTDVDKSIKDEIFKLKILLID